MTEEISGRVVKVLIANDPASILSFEVESVEVTFEGFSGDKHSGLTKPSDGRTKFYPRGTTIRNSRQISIVSREELEEIARDLHIEKLQPGWFGANLMVEDIPELTKIRPNSRLFFESGAVLLITSDNLPCSTLAREIASHIAAGNGFSEELIEKSKDKRGLVAVVELPGSIKKGERVRVVKAR